MPEETATPTEAQAERFRRPVGVSEDDRGFTVVCSDGSVWRMRTDGGGLNAWVEMQPIPGSWRAKRWGAE